MNNSQPAPGKKPPTASLKEAQIKNCFTSPSVLPHLPPPVNWDEPVVFPFFNAAQNSPCALSHSSSQQTVGCSQYAFTPTPSSCSQQIIAGK